MTVDGYTVSEINEAFDLLDEALTADVLDHPSTAATLLAGVAAGFLDKDMVLVLRRGMLGLARPDGPPPFNDQLESVAALRPIVDPDPAEQLSFVESNVLACARAVAAYAEGLLKMRRAAAS